ncbi:hypothetical protein KVR01_012302 [Diaporthe batatas]|uniref:uncharacterized protein n=1 Tax=Diaporthe batatas TaxID=748121 RepID=UPI001D0491A1|nr:uncharacterized protein KVR01_012302 [Diaporthe batatas]KAG8158030.1 hypothetical protein KVR01_012302 [Diaporthe batatas]
MLEANQVSKIMRGLKRPKAVGVGVIANEALILCVDIIEKHLEHLFDACAFASFVPPRDIQGVSDHCLTETRQTWRPITLLGALSKVLHKLVANRLSKFVLETGCLPANQFGIFGKSTTSVLHYILNQVYTAWSADFKPTVMALDITGAYPRVNRDRLLEAMARKNVPTWIILFVFSWLYESHTDLHLPGLLEINLTRLDGARADIVSFVDDTYIIVWSKHFSKNCDALKTLHDRVKIWAKANDVEFAPQKYGLLHFEPQPQTRCTQLPNIPGLTRNHLEAPEGYLVLHLRILGVMVDTQLKWGPHIDHIAKRVQLQRYNFWHISRTQTGPKLNQMRQLYIAKVLPIFSYACGAWYIPRNVSARYQMSVANINRLNKLNQAALLDVSGGMVNKSIEVIFKELHVHRMSIFLEKTSTAQRARELDTSHHKTMCLERERRRPTKSGIGEQKHPYHQLDKVARQLQSDALEMTPSKGPSDEKNRIKQLVKQQSDAESSAAWKGYRLAFINERERRIPPAHSDPNGWGAHNLKRYANLPRHQSSMLFQCRAERAAVNATLYRMRVHKDNEDSYCPDLEEARAIELVLKLGTANVDELLEKYPAEASAFAVRHFGICKNTDVPLFLPQRGETGSKVQEDKNRKRKKSGEGGGPPNPGKRQRIGGGPGPATGKKRQPRRRHGIGATKKGGKFGYSRTGRKRALKRKIWKKHRRGDSEG